MEKKGKLHKNIMTSKDKSAIMKGKKETAFFAKK